MAYPRETKHTGRTQRGESLTAGQEVTTSRTSPAWPAASQDTSRLTADVEASIADIADMDGVHEKQDRLAERPGGHAPGDREDRPRRR